MHVVGSPTAPPQGAPEGDPPHIRRFLDNSHSPILTIDSGEVVAFDCPGLPFSRDATPADLDLLHPDYPHRVVGPVEVCGAEPGDTLAVEILDVELIQDYGHTFFRPGIGLLGADVKAPHVQNFSWSKGDTYTELRPGVRIPFNPFPGIIGVMPAEPGELSTRPPRATGGNIDVRHLVAGATLYLPVEVPGALFYTGDGHAAQGDGEVCVTAIETAIRATFRLSVLKDRPVPAPQFAAPGPLSLASEKGYYGTSAAGPDLLECSRDAIRRMIDYLMKEHGLAWEEAYVLCSLVVDLKISEVVNRPNWLVSAYLPLSVFAGG